MRGIRNDNANTASFLSLDPLSHLQGINIGSSLLNQAAVEKFQKKSAIFHMEMIEK